MPETLSASASASSHAEAQIISLLALSRVKGLGDEGIARVLAQVHRQGRDLNDFFRASPESLRRDYRLRGPAARMIGEQRDSLQDQAAGMLRRARELGMVLLPPEDPAYPHRIAPFYGGEPPLLYARGNLGLLETRCVAVLNSTRPSSESLENTLGLARRLAEAGMTLLASPEGASHNLVGTAAKQAEGRLIIVLHQGLFTVFDGHPDRDPLPLSRRIEQQLDLDRTLFLSPFRPDGRWQKGNGPRRDRLLAALADTVVAVHLRSGGTIDTVCREALGCPKRIFVCQQPQTGDADPAGAALLEAGATPLVADRAGSNVDLVLRPVSTVPASVRESDDLERRRALGQFFTPPEVAAFMWDMIALLRGRKLPRTARVIDPACGEGVFLRVANERGHLPPTRLVGVDLDETLQAAWRSDALLQDAQMFRTNGLIDNPSIGLVPGAFDLVIGNPPFSGKGLKDLLRLLEPPAGPVPARGLFSDRPTDGEGANGGVPTRCERAVLDFTARHLSRYACWRVQRDSEEENDDAEPDQTTNGDGLFADFSLPADRGLQATDYDRMAALMSDWPANRPLDLNSPDMRQTIRRLASTAIEVFFTERFVQLARPGGLVAVIVPESILASDQLTGLRAWLFGHTQLLGVVSLPQKVFTGVGANARTGIIFTRRLTTAEQRATDRCEPVGGGCRVLPRIQRARVFFASPDLEAQEKPTLREYLATVYELVRKTVRSRHAKGGLP